jgi:hypothetical protein
MKMSQVLGVERSTRTRVHRDVTALLRIIQRPELFAGMVRSYTPVDDQGEQLPPETKLVQKRAEDILIELRRLETEWMDAVASKEWGNTEARTDVTVGDEVVLSQVPVGFLLFLQKRLDDILDFLKRLPTLEPGEEWEPDRTNGNYRSGTAETLKQKKVPHAHILVEATEHHPAQAETFFEDVTVGRWERTLYSGALPATRVDDLTRRVVQLRDAVIRARELANSTDVDKHEVGSAIFTYIFG